MYSRDSFIKLRGNRLQNLRLRKNIGILAMGIAATTSCIIYLLIKTDPYTLYPIPFLLFFIFLDLFWIFNVLFVHKRRALIASVLITFVLFVRSIGLVGIAYIFLPLSLGILLELVFSIKKH